MDGFDLEGAQRLVRGDTRRVCGNIVIFMNYSQGVVTVGCIWKTNTKEIHTWQIQGINGQKKVQLAQGRFFNKQSGTTIRYKIKWNALVSNAYG